jgi:predicted small secreted protein
MRIIQAGIALRCAALNKEPAMKSFKLLLLIAYAATAAACNTFEGIGKDISTLGNKIEGKADEKKTAKPDETKPDASK